MGEKTDNDMAQALRQTIAEIERLRLAMFSVYATAANGGDVIPQIEAMRDAMDQPCSLDSARDALAAHESAQPASVPDCEHVWVEYVQPVYKSASAGDVIRPGESGVKRYENLGFMCDKCGAVKPAQPASVAGWVMVPREASDHLAFAVSQCWERKAVVWKDIYRQMIAVIEREAPQPQAQPEPAQEGE